MDEKYWKTLEDVKQLVAQIQEHIDYLKAIDHTDPDIANLIDALQSHINRAKQLILDHSP